VKEISLHPSPNGGPEVELTDQQREILRGVVDGKTYRSIAEDLDLSYETVKTYMKRLREKLKLRTKVSIAIWALQNLGD